MTRHNVLPMQTDRERDEILRRVARRMDAFDPIKTQAEIDRERQIEEYRRAYRLAAVATFCGVTWTVLLIWIDPLRWVL